VVNGQSSTVGGTSAVAPLWAGLLARINSELKTPAGLINTRLYANPGAMRDIRTGNNGAYKAQPGWDACTGLGSPDGAQVLAALTP
jgi:kumamolisin